MNELADSPTEAWQQIRPVLDDALHALNAADREAVVLRFLEERSLREVGARLGLNENAAARRVDRALDKLRALLARRGVTSTTAGLTAALAVGALTPATQALAASIVSTALASGAAAGSTTLTLINIMNMTTMKVSLIGALVVAGIAVPAWQQSRLQRVQSENAQLRAQETESAALRDEVEHLRKAGADPAELERLRQYQAQTQPELLRLRGMAGLARRANLEAEQLRAQLAQQQSSASATNPGSSMMADAMKLAMEQQVEGRLTRMTASLHLTPEQVQAARDILMRQAQVMSAGAQQAFTGKFDKDEIARLSKEAGDPETQLQALLTPDQQAAYQGYKQAENAHTASQAVNVELLQLQSSINLTPEQQDQAFAALYDLSLSQLSGTAKPPATNRVDVMQWALDQKAKALEPILTPAQMDQYRQQLALQSKILQDIGNKMGRGSGSK